MDASVGIVELRNQFNGLEVLDQLLKSSPIEIVSYQTICPGRTLIITSGSVSDVLIANEYIRERYEKHIFATSEIHNIDEKVIEAIKKKNEVESIKAIGTIETRSVSHIIKISDKIVKGYNIEIIKINIGRCASGKGKVVFAGEISSVVSAIDSVEYDYMDTREIVGTSSVVSPMKETLKYLL